MPALAGPAGAFASSHVWQIYVIPKYVQGAELDAAKKFILDHTAVYSDAVYNSELYNFPCYPSTVPELPGWVENDPFGSQPADKLKVLETVNEWSVYIGYPGTANPAVMQAFGENLVVNMVARVAKGEQSAEDSVAEAHARAEEIFADWRGARLPALTRLGGPTVSWVGPPRWDLVRIRAYCSSPVDRLGAPHPSVHVNDFCGVTC